jgi:hypothetical protein
MRTAYGCTLKRRACFLAAQIAGFACTALQRLCARTTATGIPAYGRKRNCRRSAGPAGKRKPSCDFPSHRVRHMRNCMGKHAQHPYEFRVALWPAHMTWAAFSLIVGPGFAGGRRPHPAETMALRVFSGAGPGSSASGSQPIVFLHFIVVSIDCLPLEPSPVVENFAPHSAARSALSRSLSQRSTPRPAGPVTIS